MGNLFGSDKSPAKNGAPTVSDHDRAVLALKRQRVRLAKHAKQLEIRSQKEHEAAKQCFKQNKKKQALLLLKKKKYQQKLLAQTETQMLNVEKLINSISEATVNQEVFAALTVGKNALEKLNAELSLDDVEDLMDDTAEAIAYQDQIAEALGTSLTDFDETEIEDELNAILEAQELEAKHAATTQVAVAAAVAVVEEEEEEEEAVEEPGAEEVVVAKKKPMKKKPVKKKPQLVAA
jgi:charged multivesicular body protein 6